MAANIPVNFKSVWDNHPHYVKDLIGGQLKTFFLSLPVDNRETCCVALSYALNYSGGVINNDSSIINADQGRFIRTMKSSDEIDYIFEVSDFKWYLNAMYGIAENYKGDEKTLKESICNRKGIISLGHRHISIWDGQKYNYEELYYDLWTSQHNSSVAKRGIFFWEITSAWGF